MTVYFLFLQQLSAQQWMLLFASINILGYTLEIFTFCCSLYLFGFLCVFSSATKIMITNRKPIILNEVLLVILVSFIVFIIYHYDYITKILCLSFKLICVGYIFYMLFEASIYDVYFTKKWTKDRFDGVETNREYKYNPNKIRDTLKMHTIEKIRDVILILGIILMLIAVSIDTLNIAINTTTNNHYNKYYNHNYNHDNNYNDNCYNSNSNKQAFCLWLKNDVGLIEYLPIFQNNGFDDIRIINDIKEWDLNEMNITKKGHIKIIMKCIANRSNRNNKKRHFPPQGKIP